MDSPRVVSIGQAAALFGLTPSTLRWWESEGVLPAPPRRNGHRVYDEPALRRIGLAYLCRVTGAMPLQHAATVTNGSRNAHWHNSVRSHADQLADRIDQLRSAHAYLLHLLQCPDDDIVGDCPDLAAELIEHTPRGRIAGTDLLDAAGSHPEHPPTRPPRDETTRARDENRARPDCCAVCATPLARATRGRRRVYCSRACQQKRYRSVAAARDRVAPNTPCALDFHSDSTG
ncbi:helix-turn-helix domain-containing protein [Nocardia sp. NPDC055321]